MNAVVQFQETRLPYHPKIEEVFPGVNRGAWKVLVESIFPTAQTHDSVVMALTYCQRRNLDIFKRPIHIVPMWSKAAGKYVETVWPGISELRTTAFRTGQYAGCDEVEFGPDESRTFEGTTGKGQFEEEHRITVTFPQWGRMTVWRMVNGVRCPFVGPKVYWLESYAKLGRTEVPNDMWAKRPRGQLEKCVEAAALRKAFPEEIGNELTAEEMAGQAIVDNEPVVDPPKLTPPSPTAKPEPIHVPLAGRARKPKEAVTHDLETGEIIEDTGAADEQAQSEPVEAEETKPSAAEVKLPTAKRTTKPAAEKAETTSHPENADVWLDGLKRKLAKVETKAGARGVLNNEIAVYESEIRPGSWISQPDYLEAVELFERAMTRLTPAEDEAEANSP